MSVRKVRKPGPIVRPFRKGDRENVAALVAPEDMVLTVDPGANGIACLFPPVRDWLNIDGRLRPPAPIAVYPFRAFDGLDDLQQVVDSVNDGPIETRLMVVIEESFAAGRGNAATDIALARYAGAVIGALSAMTKGNLFDVALVLPAAWLGAITAKTGRGTAREERKKIARQYAELMLGTAKVEGSAKLAAHREAYCDAFGIATWWGAFCQSVRPDLCGTR